MNDRFKFRVWDKRQNEYIESPNPMPLLQANGLLAYFNNNPKAMDFYVVEFSTGLKDKNGKLVFENDVIKADIDFDLNGRVNLIRKVVFSKSAFCLEYPNDILEINKYHNIEVIGNIHQNSELLEKGGK